MAGPILSAFGNKPLFATFLPPKTFRIQPVVSASFRQFSTSEVNQERKKPWLKQSEPATSPTITPKHCESIRPLDSGFKHHLWLRSVTKWDVKDKPKLNVNKDQDVVPLAVHELKQIVNEAEKSSASYEPAYDLPSISRLDTEADYLTHALPLLLPSLTSASFGYSYHNTSDLPWNNHPDLRPDLRPRLSWPKPDLAHGFLRPRWAKQFPRASAQLGRYMSVSRNLAFPFFVLEGKGPAKSGKDEKKKAKVALYQNLNSTSRALRNLRYIHDKAIAIATQHLNDDPAQHIAALTEPGRVLSYNVHAGLSMAGDKCTPSSTSDLSTTTLAPYATFDQSVMVLSAILTTKAVHLDAHWTSKHSPWISSSKQKRKGPQTGPYYLRHRLRTWYLPNEMYAARAGLAAAIERVVQGLEGRLRAYMTVLEEELVDKVADGMEGGMLDKKADAKTDEHVKLPRVEDLIRGLAVSTQSTTD